LITDDWLPPVAVNTAAAFVLLGAGALLAGQRGDRPARRLSIKGVEAKILTGCIIAPCLVLVGGAYAYETTVEYSRTVEWVSHVQSVRSALAELYAGLSAAELAERDYVLTADPPRRADYVAQFSTMDQRVQTIAALLGDDAAQRQNLTRLRELLQIRKLRLDGVLAGFDSGGLSGARQAIDTGRNLPNLAVVRTLIQHMNDIETARLDARAGAPARVRAMALMSLLGTLVLATGTFLYLFVAVHREMLGREAAETALRAGHDALERNAVELLASNQDLESFGYSVSHDLRAPLRAIDGFASMLQEDCAALLDAQGSRYLDVIRDNSRRMALLIDDLLAFSRLGRQPVAKQQVNMDALVHAAFDEALGAHAGTRPAIRVEPLPPARADPALLRQVWVNLISNALKYGGSARHPSIEISADEGPMETVYRIRDNGVGFPMDCRDKLFEVFHRLNRDEHIKGTGVGLAIVQRVVNRHGGRVWAEARVNEGALFSFALPRETPAGLPVADAA
jgi:signal transduction histidine kinase